MLGEDFNYESGKSEVQSKSTGFKLSCSSRSNLNVDVYRIDMDTTKLSEKIRSGEWGAFYRVSADNLKHIIDAPWSLLDSWKVNLNYGGFVFRTRGGATSQPYEDERRTSYYMPGTVLDQKTMMLDNLKIWTDKPVQSNVPYDEPARFTIKLSNESEFPSRVTKALHLFRNDDGLVHNSRFTRFLRQLDHGR